jgi:hypothetical protein
LGGVLPGAVTRVQRQGVQVKEDHVTRLALIIVSLVVGIVLAVGAAYTAVGVIGSPPAPANNQQFNYGSP